MERPITTLFMLMPVDGKAINTHEQLSQLGVLKLESMQLLLVPISD